MSKIITTGDLTSYMSPKTLTPGVAAQVVEALNDWVESQTHRVWGETKPVTERYDLKRTLWLRHQDVTAIASIKVGYPGQTQTTLDSSGYFFNEFGRVTMFWQANGRSNSSPLYNDYLEVTYSHGNSTVPNDLKLAALVIAAAFYNYAANDGHDLAAEQIGAYRVQYASKKTAGGATTRDPSMFTADAAWDVIDKYSKRRN